MKKKSFIVIVIILIAIILGLCVFIAYDKNLFGIKGESKKESSNSADNQNIQNDNLEKKDELYTINFDESKSLNTDTSKWKYSITSSWSMDGISVKCNKKTCGISISWDFINRNYFNLNPEKNGTEDVEINNFTGNVVDIFISSFGQSTENGTLLFLLEDGTVEYIPLFYALKNNDIKSYGKIDGVEKITKFLSVGVIGNGTDTIGGYHSIIALRSDGSFYDLFENLASLQYYNEG